MRRTRRPKDLSYLVDFERLRRLRKEKGLTLKQVEAATGIRSGNLSDFEHGRVMLSWPRLRDLLRFYGVDLLTAHDFLRLCLLEGRLIQGFRGACRRHGTTPGEALRDFLMVFSNLPD